MGPVLVTGGAGFLGSHLCDRLTAAGVYVICMDNFSTGAKTNVAHLLFRENFKVVEHDVTVPIHLQVEQIYNLACPASPKHYQRNPLQTMRASVYGTANMLDLAMQSSATILQASTSEVYGDPEVHPQVETYCGSVNPIGQRGCYDEGKRCAETICFDYHRQHGTDIKVARIFNTYGPRMQPSDGRVVSNFICQALKRRPITVYGTGRQTRSFCYVDDLIEGLIRLMNSPIGFTGPVNIGNPDEVTMVELAKRIINLTGSATTIEMRGNVPDDPCRRCPDITIARSHLNWSPRIDLQTGLTRTISYFARELKIEGHEMAHDASEELPRCRLSHNS
jgi:UDP-glucuronate decarboxylase